MNHKGENMLEEAKAYYPNEKSETEAVNPSEHYQKYVIGEPSQIMPSTHPAIQPMKNVSFDKGVLRNKLAYFVNLVKYFHSSRSQEGSTEDLVKNAEKWIVDQMTDDIFSTLKLDKFSWEFDILNKQKRNHVLKHPGLPNDAVEDHDYLHTCISGRKLKPNAIRIDLDDPVALSDSMREQIEGRKKVKKGKPFKNEKSTDAKSTLRHALGYKYKMTDKESDELLDSFHITPEKFSQYVNRRKPDLSTLNNEECKIKSNLDGEIEMGSLKSKDVEILQPFTQPEITVAKTETETAVVTAEPKITVRVKDFNRVKPKASKKKTSKKPSKAKKQR